MGIMSRRRYLSTAISTDKVVNRLAMQSDFAALLYTWLIPHAEDDATLCGDPEELLMTVMPGRRDRQPEDVADALALMADAGLIIWEHGAERVAFPESFYRHQTYISAERRRTAQSGDEGREPAQTGAKGRLVKGFVFVEGKEEDGARLLALAVDELPKSESTDEDYAKTINQQLKRGCGVAQIEKIIFELADWWPKNAKSQKRKAAHATLRAWLQKEDPRPDSSPGADSGDDDGIDLDRLAEKTTAAYEHYLHNVRAQ
jgi:hypothetical protein